MKKVLGILALASLLVISCNTKKKEAAAAEEARIRKLDSLVTQMDSVKTEIDSSMNRVDVLIEDL